MGTYWTEETVTTVKRTYIKGTFQGKYRAHRSEAWSRHHVEYYHMTIYEAEVTLLAVRQETEKDFPEAANLKAFEGALCRPISCYDPTSDTWFKLNIEEPRIIAVELSQIVSEGNEHLGTITGTIFGEIIKLETETQEVAHETIDPEPVYSTSFSGWTRTTVHEFNFQNGSRYRRDQYRHSSGVFRWGSWYGVGTPLTFFTILRWGFGLVFGSFLLVALIHLSWFGLIFLGVFFLINLFGRFRSRGVGATLFSWFYGLFSLFVLLTIGIGLFQSFHHHSYAPAPTRTHNYTTTRPVRHPRTGQPDAWIIHHQRWQDPDGNDYEGDVRVLNSVYQQAISAHPAIQELGSINLAYQRLAQTDQPQLQGVYHLFDSLKKADRMDTVKFANMLVSFVQDIPYSSVTDGACGGSSDGGLSNSAAGTPTQCIGGIPFGVQSPVEFMANFQGDCDTRTLFLFTVFDHYHYPVAIVNSIAYKHSLLGIKLPFDGSAKELGPDRYVLWETTSAGFPAGRISPQIDHMDYWDFALINSTTHENQ